MNEDLLDEELKELLKRKRQENWIVLMLMLCETEEKLGKPITEFTFKKDKILIKVSKNRFIRVSLI